MIKSNEEAQCGFNIGDKVPYINTASKICWAEISVFKEPNDRGKVWFVGIDTKTHAEVYYPCYLSKNYLEAIEEFAASQFPSQGLNFLPILEENYKAQVYGLKHYDKTEKQKTRRRAVIAEYKDLIEIYKHKSQNESAPSQELREEERKVFDTVEEMFDDMDKNNLEPEVPNPDLASVASHSSTVGNSIQRSFKLEIYGLGDETAYLRICFDDKDRMFLKFIVNEIEVPDFVLYGEQFEKFKSALLNQGENDERSVATGDAQSDEVGKQKDSVTSTPDGSQGLREDEK